MSAIAQKQRKKSACNNKQPISERSKLLGVIIAAATGALLGLSAPGINQWYLAWVGLVPLLLLSCQSINFNQAFWRGLTFGMSYNLVYLNWYLGLHPLTWLGFNQWQSVLLALASWLIVSLYQAIIIACFAVLLKILPLTCSFIPARVDGRWCLPALVAIPLLWVVLLNKIGNVHDCLGVPWTMIEYSQYQQLPLLQITSTIGGIGLGFLLVMVNTALAGLLATASRKLSLKPLSAATSGVALRQALTVALLLALVYVFGLSSLASAQSNKTVKLSILQGNINIDMQKSEHRFSLKELLDHYRTMAATCPPGLCIGPENSLPAYIKTEPKALEFLSQVARTDKLSLVFGALDHDQGQAYNSVFAITSAGQLLPSIYHKRYLVPFGEYTPSFVKYLPAWIQRLTIRLLVVALLLDMSLACFQCHKDK